MRGDDYGRHHPQQWVTDERWERQHRLLDAHPWERTYNGVHRIHIWVFGQGIRDGG